MRGHFASAVSGVVIGVLLAASVQGAEVAVTAGKLTRLADGVALLCKSTDATNFKGYPLSKDTTPYVVSISWQLAQSDSVLMTLSEEASSRMRLLASGRSHPPRAIGDDNPPPPPPGRALAPTDHWTRVSKLSAFKGGGRFFTMSPDWPRDFLFELPATSGVPEALRLKAIIKGTEYSVRCELGR
jgi:hypothetical protein